MKLLQGNPGKRALRTDEPEPAIGRPVRPRWLTPRARGEWDRLVKLLEGEQRLTVSDGPALTAAAVAFDAAMDLRTKAERLTDGDLWLRVKASERLEWERYRKCVNDLCLSPGTRARAHTNPGRKDSPLEALWKRQGNRPHTG